MKKEWFYTGLEDQHYAGTRVKFCPVAEDYLTKGEIYNPSGWICASPLGHIYEEKKCVFCGYMEGE